MILGLVQETVDAGARLKKACEILGIDARTVQRWKRQGIGDDRRAGPRRRPGNRLTGTEQRHVLEILNRPDFCDLSPKQVVVRLADEGIYVASESTMYRILRAVDQVKHRERSCAPRRSPRPRELVATGPNQVWSWDITYLASPVRGVFFYLYMVIDVWSRKIVGFAVHEEESSDHAAALVASACDAEGIAPEQLVIHSDNGSPMKGATLLATLQELGVTTSFSRPQVKNDNPFSESLFRTTKYRPEYPNGPFGSLDAARAWVAWFVRWYNREHRHSAIRFVTPAQRHAGQDAAILQRRREVYETARARRPERWTGRTRDWTPVDTVTLNPATTVRRDERVA